MKVDTWVVCREKKIVSGPDGIDESSANDGKSMISVLWGDNCQTAFKTYDVKHLNRSVIKRIV